jgi:hypothetical protein
VLPKHQCEILFSIENEAGDEKWITLLFEGVEAFKTTYLKALGSVDREWRKQAYGCVLSVDDSTWLEEVKKQCYILPLDASNDESVAASSYIF